MKQVLWTAFEIDRALTIPVFEQICTKIRTQIVDGELVAGTKLPPTRTLSIELGVSRSTVVTAYEQLVAEGYLKSVQGAGFTVSPMGDVELQAKMDVPSGLDEKEELPKILPLRASSSDMSLFPHAQWGKTVARVCRTNPESLLVGNSAKGNFDLRKEIAKHLSEWRGIETSAHNIIVTAGASDALELCIRALADSQDIIALEDPGYEPLHNFVQAFGYRSMSLSLDEEGAVLPTDKKLPKVIILTPSHQYPIGGAMSPARRLEFIQWAQDNDVWLIEDDYDSEFRYAGRPIPAMAGFDQSKRTIYVGSFSKIFSNALRMGYVVLPDELMPKIKQVQNRFGVKASIMPQQALAEFMENGEFYRHLRRVRRIYGERHKCMTDKLSAEFTEFGHFTNHHAGMQLAFFLNDDFDDVEIARHAEQKGVVVEALSNFCTNETQMNGFVLGFSCYSTDVIETSLDVLRDVLMASKN